MKDTMVCPLKADEQGFQTQPSVICRPSRVGSEAVSSRHVHLGPHWPGEAL